MLFLFSSKLEAYQVYVVSIRSRWLESNDKNNNQKADRIILLTRFDGKLWALHNFASVDGSSI